LTGISFTRTTRVNFAHAAPVSDVVEEEVRRAPFLEAALVDGIVQPLGPRATAPPGVERRCWRKVSIAAVMMAVRRLRAEVAGDRRPPSMPAVGDLTCGRT